MTLLEIPGLDESLRPETGEPSGAAQWRLSQVELVNWGTFDGYSRIDVARKGHLITGASGSGKSSLLDAIATVLTPRKWLRFNAAAQDTSVRGNDRSLVSYVRGAWSREADAEEDRTVASYLRSGATWSGVLLRFDNGRDAPVTAVRLFHLRGASVDPADLKDLAFVARADVALMDFQPYVERGIEVRRIKNTWQSAVVTSNGSHKSYFSRLRRMLGIESEGALQLLHKTQSAKNLGSLDQLFRSFMLDEPVTFKRADNAVEQFGELNEAHRLVVDAREQLDVLRALDPLIERYESSTKAADDAARLRELIEPFQTALERRLADEECRDLTSKFQNAEAQVSQARARKKLADEDLKLARSELTEGAGRDVDHAREKLNDAHRETENTWQRHRRFATMLADVGIDVPQTLDEFTELKRSAAEAVNNSANEPAAASHDDNKAYFESDKTIADIDGEIDALRRRRSNLPARLQASRRMIAGELGIGEAALPFAGELIDVKPDYADWTGAIERVMRPIASALLVDDDYVSQVRHIVESRHLGTRLVFEAVPKTSQAPKPARSDRSLLHRIDVADGAFHDWLTSRLSGEFDYECVDTPDELADVTKGVTVGGQVKKSARRYEKNDRDRVDDRSKWILGADNAAKIEELLARRAEAQAEFDRAKETLDKFDRERRKSVARVTILQQVQAQEWSEIDVASADAAVEHRARHLQLLSEDNPELRAAIDAEQAASDAVTQADRELETELDERARLSAKLDDVQNDLDRLAARDVAMEIDEADNSALNSRYRARARHITRSTAADVGRQVSNELVEEERHARSSAASARSGFEDGAHRFATQWPTAAADLTPSIDDRASFQALKQTIESRGLPQHEQRFLTLLRDRSRDVVGHLLSDIREAPRVIRERIDPVNASLSRSEFDRDRFLHIRVKERRTSEVSEFMDDLRTVVDGAWADEGLDSAERRFAVLEKVMHRLASSESADRGWRARCLDTREHVTFQAHEVDRNGAVMAAHDSSAGLSGGQRQKLVIFCLAAALRYQLAPDEAAIPTYATIILDEAFDKADTQYTRMAMNIFFEFGFHMILATPQKLLQTIEPYVGAVTSISNESRRKSLLANVVFGEAGDGGGASEAEHDT